MELQRLNPNQVAHRAKSVGPHLSTLEGDSIRAVLEACGVWERLGVASESDSDDTPNFDNLSPAEMRKVGMRKLFAETLRGNAAAARVWKDMMNEAEGEDDASNLLVEIVPYDVPDKVIVPREPVVQVKKSTKVREDDDSDDDGDDRDSGEPG